jgi:putative transposase
MSQNTYFEINLHYVWHTKESRPMLTPAVEEFVHRYLRGRLINTPGVYVHEVNGTENHVHVVVSIAPTVNIAELAGQMKGSSSHEANKQFGEGGKVLFWQDGYGVVSFGTGDLEWVKAYVRNQKEHHARGTIHDRLERITPLEPPPDAAEAEPRETP